MDNQKIIIGTEIYMTEGFSDVWFRAAEKNIPKDIRIIVFDNNPNDRAESIFVKYLCSRSDQFKYVRLLPHCHVGHTTELLRQYALNEKAGYYFHLDMDCPPLKGVFEKMMWHIKDGATTVNEKAGSHCFICDTLATTDMSCQRLPWRDGFHTRFSVFLGDSNMNNGLKYFDNCRAMFHELIIQGYRVDIVDYNFVHASAASYKDKDSSRVPDWINDKNIRTRIEQSHNAFWDNAEIKELMCQK